ncbi:hypothetical protein [Sphingopyxis sp. 113P3]|uniref:hypothetical protein n=1 Tax=Sphingopyxis sp. (strain 113P3) TaxID=292913 RepID=UPI0006AD54DA|nr:hypothetical protein [Sphingopyxis sp. 113P3]ALC12224.1 surface protein C [Sphingopyxis sp. 113P3]
MTKAILTAIGTLALLGAGSAAAFQSETQAPPAEQPESVPADLDAVAADLARDKEAADGTTPEERANTARLNAEQAARARAENVAYEQQVAAIAQEQAAAEAAYAEETAAYEAEKARVAAEAAAQRQQWEADVAACRAGDTTRCAQPASPPKP